MNRVRFMLPEVKSAPDTRPTECPHCGGGAFHRHGQVSKPIQDLYIQEVTAMRYRCADCGRTFRHYPSGVDGHNQSKRLRGLAGLMWALGLSHRSVSHVLTALGCALSRMSSWRDVQEAGSNAIARWMNRKGGRVVVMGADETVVRVKGNKTVIGFVTDASSGQLLGIDVLVDRDRAGFRRLVEGLCGSAGCRCVGQRRPVHVQAGGRGSWSGASDMPGAREEECGASSGGDRRMGLGSGVDMAVAV